MRAGLPCPVHKWVDPVPGIIPGRISDAFGSQTSDSNEWWGPGVRQEGGTFTSISPRSMTSIQCWNHTAGRTKHIRKLKALSATNSDLARLVFKYSSQCGFWVSVCFVFGDFVSPLANIFNQRSNWVCFPICLQNTITFFQKMQLEF